MAVTRVVSIAVLSIVVLTVGCDRKGDRLAAVEKHALPGFSLSLPKGEVSADKSQKYGEGSYDYGVKGSWIVSVAWSPGPISPSDRKSYVEAWKLELDRPLSMRAGSGTSETFPGTNHGPARVTFATCGRRHIVIGSIAHEDVDLLHAAVLGSFACTPDAAKERETGARVDLADRTGWQRIGADSNVTLLSREGGAKVVMALYYASEPDKATLQRLVTKYQATFGDGDPRPLISPVMRGWARTIQCSKDSWIAVFYIETGTGAAPRETIDGVRCLRPDEPDVAWPPAPPELQQLVK